MNVKTEDSSSSESVKGSASDSQSPRQPNGVNRVCYPDISQLGLEDQDGQVAEHAVERGRIYGQNLKPPPIDLIQQLSAITQNSEESKKDETDASQGNGNSPDIGDYCDFAF